MAGDRWEVPSGWQYYVVAPNDWIMPDVVAVMAEGTEETPLDKVKKAILDLPQASRQNLYEFLYTLGHRMW